MNDDPRYRELRDRVERTLEAWLPDAAGPGATVAAAMRHAVLGGGKRLRPVLALAACEACGGRVDDALPGAAALELVHTYSLVHDDLPAMDDDDLRRGRPTVHKVFGEAVAILAGDALHTLAFEWIAGRPEGAGRASARAEAARVLAVAAGVGGMVAGQIADLEAESRGEADLDRVRWIHEHKTGALLAAAAEIGGVAADAPAGARRALAAYGRALGLAFQIADDVLDETSTAEALGKTPGKDARAGKATYPALLGLDGSRREARTQVERALSALDDLERPAPLLADLARYAASRSS